MCFFERARGHLAAAKGGGGQVPKMKLLNANCFGAVGKIMLPTAAGSTFSRNWLDVV